MSFDYQSARLVAITQPMIEVPKPIIAFDGEKRYDTGKEWPAKLTAEEFIAYTARVSNPGNQNNTATASKLIKYLIKNHHWSPFEGVSATIEIKTTRDIGRQILRHRSFSFQEFSQRYAAVDTQIEVIRETRLQDATNRQKSLRIDRTLDPQLDIEADFAQTQTELWDKAIQDYNYVLKLGVAKEQARALLPEGLTPTTMYMSGTLRSFIHWAQIRTDPNTTQLEHVDIANKAVEALRPHFPNIFDALEQ